MTSTTPAHLEPSQLGTKEYWDALYTNEITNHAANPSDEGTVWFDDSDAQARTLSFLDSLTESADFEHEVRREDASFLDLGCGNGAALFALRDEGWLGELLGVDYSRRSVELARQVAKARKENPDLAQSDDGSDDEDEGEDEPEENGDKEGAQDQDEVGEDAPEPQFREWDVLHGDLSVPLSGPQSRGWTVVLDKGTFDAICLSSELDPATGRRACEGYRARVLRLVCEGGLFLVTSCNWTEEELRAWFEGGAEAEAKFDAATDGDKAGRLVMVGRVPYPSFQFGGVKGQTISTLCFQKRR